MPTVFFATYEEEQQAALEAALAVPPPMMMSMSEAASNLVMAIGGTTNGTVELEIGWPTNFTDTLEIFATTNLVLGNWEIIPTNIATTGETNFVWIDEASTNQARRFYQAGNADLDSDGDALADAREIILYGTEPSEPDTDDDGLDDGWEVAYGFDPLGPSDGTDRWIARELPDLPVSEPTSNYPAVFAAFNPPVTNMAVHADAPEIAEYTRIADTGDAMAVVGDNLSSHTNAVGSDITTVESIHISGWDRSLRVEEPWPADFVVELHWSAWEEPLDGDALLHAGVSSDTVIARHWYGDLQINNGAGGWVDMAYVPTNRNVLLYDALNERVVLNGATNALSGDVGAFLYWEIANIRGAYNTYPIDLESFKAWSNGVLVVDSTITPNATVANAVDGTEYSIIGTNNEPYVAYSRSYAVSGEEGGDSQYVVFGTGHTGVCDVVSQHGRIAQLVLPSKLPAGGTYLLWPRNGAGDGKPVVLNQTEVWWTSGTAVEGGSFSVYGRNLGTDCHAYIAELDAWLESVYSDPYKATFTLPAGTTNGTYTVYAHNTTGRKYGWSTPSTISVVSEFSWDDDTNTWIDVTDPLYGATGDGVTNDWLAINAAINACSSGDTVYFPSGTYRVSVNLDIKSGVRYRGDGAASVIKPHPTHAEASGKGLLFGSDYPPADNVRFESLALVAAEGSERELLMLLGSDNLVLTNVVVDSIVDTEGGGTLTIPDSNVLITDCEITLSGNPGLLAIGGGENVVITGCDFILANQCSQAIGGGGFDGLDINHCTFRPYDETTATGLADGRLVVLGYNARNLYYAHNTSSNCSPRTGTSNANTGEQILFEGIREHGHGYVASSTPWSTVLGTLSTNAMEYYVTNQTTQAITTNRHPDPYHVSIIAGKGYGQDRRFSRDGQTITLLDRSWNVVPDATSRILLSTLSDNVAVYGNTFDGLSPAQSGLGQTASTAMSVYGGGSSIAFDGNTVTDTQRGIDIRTLSGYGPKNFRAMVPIRNLVVQDNTIDSAIDGIYIKDEAEPGDITDGGLLAPVIRDTAIHNVASNAVKAAGYTKQKSNFGMILDGLVATNCTTGILLSDSLSHPALLDCSFVGAGSGVDIAYSTLQALRGNSWSFPDNYHTNATGSISAGAILTLPVRIVDVSDAATNTAVEVWNTGTESMAWTAATTNAWIDILADGGTVDGENATGILAFSADVSGLATGDTGSIDVVSGTQTNQLAVVYR